ncbi:MAG TPA: helix-turn-helix domain-containing protein [Anaerolineae bacterium]|nr:helix-turn-helix domain-containing protein [Anaerolineae bacterium]
MTSPKLTSDEAILRRKILGVKIRHARTRSGLNEQEIATALGITPAELAEIELGQRLVTLPQLEAMAVIFNIPVNYFWSDGIIREPNLNFPTQEAMLLRQRIIGILLRQARERAGRSQQEVAQMLGYEPDQIEEYELGRLPIPLQELEHMAHYYKLPISHFVDQGMMPHKNGNQPPTLNEIADFAQLPAEVKEFLANPANLLYINIAMKLSDLSADTLRSLAEGLLEVTY